MARKWANHLLQVHPELATPINSGRSSSNGNHGKVLCESPVSSASFNFKESHTKSPNDDLFLCLRHLLLWGRLIGIIPFRNLHLSNKSCENGGTTATSTPYPLFRWESWEIVFNILAIALQTLNISINFYVMIEKIIFKGISTPNDLVGVAYLFVQNVQSFATYLFFLARGQQLGKLLASWPQNKDIEITDTNMKTYVGILCAVFMGSIIGENIVFHLTLFPICPKTPVQEMLEQNMTAFQVYYSRGQRNSASKISYNSTLTICLFICNKLTVYAATYGDIFIIAFCIVVYHRFKIILILAENSQQELLQVPSRQRFVSSHIKWKRISKMYFEAYEFTHELNCFLNPLVFISYFTNVFFICINIQQGFQRSSGCNFIEPIFFVWAILHSLAKVTVLTLTAAKVHDYCKGMQHFVHRCPNELYTKQVRRLEQMTMTPIGLSGLGSFTITKEFILSIGHVVFTYEVILAQTTMQQNSMCVRMC